MNASDPMYLMRLEPVGIIYDRLRYAQRELDSLAQWNGTVPGARAIAAARDKRDALRAELDRRDALNDPQQDDD